MGGETLPEHGMEGDPYRSLRDRARALRSRAVDDGETPLVSVYRVFMSGAEHEAHWLPNVCVEYWPSDGTVIVASWTDGPRPAGYIGQLPAGPGAVPRVLRLADGVVRADPDVPPALRWLTDRLDEVEQCGIATGNLSGDEGEA